MNCLGFPQLQTISVSSHLSRLRVGSIYDGLSFTVSHICDLLPTKADHSFYSSLRQHNLQSSDSQQDAEVCPYRECFVAVFNEFMCSLSLHGAGSVFSTRRQTPMPANTSHAGVFALRSSVLCFHVVVAVIRKPDMIPSRRNARYRRFHFHSLYGLLFYHDMY